ncbi:MAG TPA: type I-C CRISPR-associated protein Cas8c/Csd1 [Leptospiraceae bacterium]|nr:type I-C CRISPR-associated protein Cas8c/Csd1 [Leptospiraceae bacterium]HMW08678.1 type I-C CRISPR-associated protein Cas8c/Csd1 [Leptospiraceae bacterium]HMX34931.1 type I-C CRISPR-associated protein Cas8c/Csd1 [Leptospiraceae bacterium]HMY34391.1 type I-C CRISPR-associated protein Cas8c/Csd1 [Leptospiraceae bacterium]HMZ67196.1 type I-C CRISPR-associated protein Cas8c/Csd1 [Leptospiraceae bacterium]
MILKELVRYYERKLEEGEISREGFEVKEIPYLIEIDKDGNFIRFIVTWLDEKKKRANKYTIPKAVVRARGINANLLWDNSEYVFGIESKDKQKDFIRKVQDLKENSKEDSLESIIKFLTNYKISDLQKDENWKDIQENKPNLTFKLKGQNDIVCANEKIIKAISKSISDESDLEKGICLVTGEDAVIERLHAKISGVANANTVGANIVSFNLNAFESYGKEQGANAPTSKYANFAYGTAINTLLSKDSHQKILIGDTTTIFWSERKSELEDEFAFLFKPVAEEEEKSTQKKKGKEAEDNKKIKEHFQSPFSGKNAKLKHLLNDNTKFYILGLAPNAARISIRFWYPSTVGEISKNIEQHFQDLKLEIPNNDSGFISLNRILRSTAIQGKLDNINPLLAGKLITSIISGSEYPRTLLSSLINRMKAEQSITFVRVSVLKAILNRKGRNEKFKNYKELQEKMDESNIDIAYRLGRLFAVMEKMQQNAINSDSTIKDRYYTSASTRPASVFPVLFSLSNHHASKLGNKSIYLEKLKGEILEPLNGSIPKTFSLEEQGLFALGYYQQKQELFKKKEVNPEKEGENK